MCTRTTRRSISALLLFLCVVFGLPVAQAQGWPDFDAKWQFKIIKLAGAEPTDPFWMHLHIGQPGFTSVTLGVRIHANNPSPLDPALIPPGNQLRYTVHGIPVSGWLTAPWTFVLDISNPALSRVMDGIHDINFEVQGPDRARIRPLPVFLHLARGLAVDPTVPILAHDANSNYDDYENSNGQGPGVVYVNRADRNHVAYPLASPAAAWTLPPYQADLYQRQMMPHSDLFLSAQMWWEEPGGTISQGLTFIRSIGPKFGGDHLAQLYNAYHVGGPQDPNQFGYAGHRSLPFKDGPRGIGWTSPFITGQVDSTGGLAYVETGGPLRYMKPDGHLVTVAGWRLAPGKDPVWFLKPLNSIRGNQEFVGTWLSGQYADLPNRGFHYPTDVAIDPLNEKIWYVASYGDHVIWKVVVDPVTWLGTVSVFAGSVTHQVGYANGTGTAARFHGPTSLVFDPLCDCLYVADTHNSAIRKITRSGVVTTVIGTPNMGNRLATRGLPTGIVNPATGEYGCHTEFGKTECFDEIANRVVAKLDVSAAEAASGIRHEPYLPMTIRVDSTGRLVVLDMGYATISRIHPTTGESKKLGNIIGRYDRFLLGWAWLDVNRFGTSGPLDSIYWLIGVGSGPLDGEDPLDMHTNELLAWMPAEGGKSQWVSGKDWAPYPDGWGRLKETDIPHYPWLVAIDPRGGMYLTGMGEHGVTRIDARRATDPVVTNWSQYYDGKMLWLKGDQPGGASLSFVHGYEGHNYLGFADAWSITPATTDAQIIAMFGIPQSIVGNQAKLATILSFLRLNSGTTAAGPPIVPPPPVPMPMPMPMPVPMPVPVPVPVPSELTQTWERNNTKLVCIASGQFRVESLQMVDTCIQQFPH